MSGYSPARIFGAIRRRGLAFLRQSQYRPGSLPLAKNAVLFDSFNGKNIGDSPLDIFQELRKTHPHLKFYWTTNSKTQAPEGAIGVKFESRAWFDCLASAEYLVTNSALPWYFKKVAGQKYLQTWHGTPLKKLVHDVPAGGVSKTYLESMDRDSAGWDYLVSPSPFCTNVFANAFKYRGRILETGYPRNDRLTNSSASDRKRIRESLGVLDSKTILVLYAPTWRDYQVTASGNFDLVSYLDPKLKLPNGFQLMLRGHSMTHAVDSSKAAGNAIDVTNYPDITDLYLAADVLITDYSSVMFDFSVTGKPILFLTPDFERYEAERGFYFDFKTLAPGPILRSEAEVLETLSKLPEIAKQYQTSYEHWRNKFNSLEDGSATKRVISAVWGS